MSDSKGEDGRVSPKFDVIEIMSEERMRVIQLGRCHFKLVGRGLRIADFLPGEMVEETETETETSASGPTKRLNTKNPEIVIQGENAAKLSENEWLIIHRINMSGKTAITVDELCKKDVKNGIEPVWSINDLPTEKTRYNTARNAEEKLIKSGIMLKFWYKDNVYFIEYQ